MKVSVAEIFFSCVQPVTHIKWKWIKRCWKKLWVWKSEESWNKSSKLAVKLWLFYKNVRKEWRKSWRNRWTRTEWLLRNRVFSMMTSARSQMSKRWSNTFHSPKLMMSMYCLGGGVKQSNLWAIGYPQGVEINCIPSISQSFSPFYCIISRYYNRLFAGAFSCDDHCQ